MFNPLFGTVAAQTASISKASRFPSTGHSDVFKMNMKY